MNEPAYTAFITYSHRDSKNAAWLQRQLEAYRVPSRLVGRSTARGTIQRRIGTIFRDRDELPAGGDLAQTIRSALKNSRFLIVICSPAAVSSPWIDLEISEFRKTHRDEDILCFIVAGEPFATAEAGKDSECFPKALGYHRVSDSNNSAPVEPIAADMRETGDGRRLAKLKLISGLLDIGLDEIVQRDSQRRNRNMFGLSMLSLSGMAIMAILSLIAMDARNNEELRRAEAEDLIEFMLTDLRDKLDAVGRLDVLDAVGEKAIEYYSKVSPEEQSDPSLGRRARAFLLLGEVDERLGNMESARAAFEEAYSSTHKLLTHSPLIEERIYDHAQSAFWVGYLERQLGNTSEAEVFFLEYLALAQRLIQIDPVNVKWLIELGSANLNLGVFALETSGPTTAIDYFETSREIYATALDLNPEDQEILWQIAQTFAWLADAHDLSGSLYAPQQFRQSEIRIYQKLLELDPGNQSVNWSLLTSHHALADLWLLLGDIDQTIANLTRAQQYADVLSSLDPDNTDIIKATAKVYSAKGVAYAYRNEFEKAKIMSSIAIEMASGLMDLDSSVFRWRLTDLRIRLDRINIDLQAGNALASLSGATAIEQELEGLQRSNPHSAEVRRLMAECNYGLGKAYSASGDNGHRDRLADSTIALLSDTASNIPLKLQAILASAYMQAGRETDGRELASSLVKMDFRHPEYAFLANEPSVVQ